MKRKRKAVRILRLLLTIGLGIGLAGACSLHTLAQTPSEVFEEQKRNSGVDRFWEEMPPEIKEQFNSLGIKKIDMESITTLHPKSVGERLWGRILTEARSPLSLMGVLLGTLILCSVAAGMQTLSSRQEGSQTVFQAVALLAVCATVLPSLLACIRRVQEAMTGSAVFMGSFVPVYAALLASSGKIASALSYQTVVLWTSQLLTGWIQQWVMPLMTVALGMNVVGNLGTPWRLSAVGGFIHKVCAWSLGLISTVFTGLLSLQNSVGAAADTLSAKALRFSVANLVPVVGGAVSEALNTMRGGLGLLKSTFGGVGILSVVLLLLPPLISCIWWHLTLSLGGTIADVLLLKPIGDLLRSIAGTVKTLIGMLAFCGLFMTVTTAIVGGVGAGG